MKRKTITVGILLFVLIASMVGLGFVSLVEANFSYQPPDIAINSPANGATYYSSEVPVDLMVNLRGDFPYYATFAICRLDGENPINITFVLVNETGQWSGSGIFNNVSGGSHQFTVGAQLLIPSGYNSNWHMLINASSTFNVDLPNPPTPTTTPLPTNPPAIDLSLANSTYDKSAVPLVFNVNDSTSWMGFSLDNQANVTLNGNSTLTGLTEGNHSLVVYANDTFGNMGKSDTVFFNVSLPAPTPSPTPTPTATAAPSTSVPEFPTWTAFAAALIITVVVVAAFAKRWKKQS